MDRLFIVELVSKPASAHVVEWKTCGQHMIWVWRVRWAVVMSDACQHRQLTQRSHSGSAA